MRLNRMTAIVTGGAGGMGYLLSMHLQKRTPRQSWLIEISMALM